MAEEPPTLHQAPPMCQRVVVAAEERKGAWMLVACLLLSGFLLGGRSGHWPELRRSPEKFIGKIFQQQRGILTAVEGFEAFCDKGGVTKKGLNH